jgi:L-iditol 2-dehydrogenase
MTRAKCNISQVCIAKYLNCKAIFGTGTLPDAVQRRNAGRQSRNRISHESTIYDKGKFMKSAFKTQNEGIVVKDFQLRQVRPDELRVKVDVCGICGTDLHYEYTGEDDSQFGHEIAGTILEMGSAVTGFELGDKVALDSATPCGCCDNCRNTRQELCTKLKSFFCINSFGFAEEMLVPAICAMHYQDMSPEVACLQEPLGVAIDVFKLTDISIDSNVLIIGAGPIGLMAAALAKHVGARKVFVSDFRNRSARFGLAQNLGINGWHDPSETPLEEFDFGCNIDRIIVTAPPVTLPSAFAAAATGAIISFIGIGGTGKENCTFDADAFHFKKLQLRASFASPALYGPLALQYLHEGVIDGESFISARFKLDDMVEAMEAAIAPDALKVVVLP